MVEVGVMFENGLGELEPYEENICFFEDLESAKNYSNNYVAFGVNNTYSKIYCDLVSEDIEARENALLYYKGTNEEVNWDYENAKLIIEQLQHDSKEDNMKCVIETKEYHYKKGK